MATARSRPGWLLPVCLATAAYLVVELSFNARLLDVVGGGASMHEIDRIEFWGRLISGFALALVFWPLIITRASGKGRRALPRLLGWSLVAIAGMFLAQEALLQALVARSSPAQLQSAQHLVLLQRGLQEGLVDLDGLDLDREQMAAPDGKALLAMFPMLGSGLGELVGERFDATQRKEVAHNLARTAMGDPNAHLEAYGALVGQLSDAYDEYRKGLAKIDAAGAKAWTDYRSKLRKRGLDPDAVPRRHHNRVRRQVRSGGVPVPSNWSPHDRRGFIAAATRHERDSARRRFGAELGTALPRLQGVEPPDTLAAFLVDKDIQPGFLATLGYSCMPGFDINMPTARDFKRKFYDREIDCLVDASMSAEGDAEAGRDARRALLVPFIALGLSLFGAFAHVAKFVLYAATLVRGHPLFPARGAFAAVAIALPLLVIWLCATRLSSPATGNALYGKLEARLPAPLALAMRGTIHGQMIGYPVFEAVRAKVLRGFDFGYSGQADQPSSAP